MGFLRDLRKRSKNLGQVGEKTSKIICINPDFKICIENVLILWVATGLRIKTNFSILSIWKLLVIDS